jgi:hypothetical protein
MVTFLTDHSDLDVSNNCTIRRNNNPSRDYEQGQKMKQAERGAQDCDSDTTSTHYLRAVWVGENS